MNTTISYQGEPGANSHIIIQEAYPDWTPLPCATFEDAFTAVQDGSAALGMIPIENSIAGRVADIHHLLPASGLHIVGEQFLPIHFQLMALPGVSLEEIRTVHSHVHALGQCRKAIRKLGLKAVVAADTAGAAAEVAASGDKTRAAIASTHPAHHARHPVHRHLRAVGELTYDIVESMCGGGGRPPLADGTFDRLR